MALLWKTLAAVVVLVIAAKADGKCVDCAEYVNSTAAEKEAVIARKILDSQYKHVPHLLGPCDVGYDWRNKVDFNSQFDRFSDERSPNMKRFFHLQGMTALVKLEVPENTTFTGIFSGAEHGILRWSPLAPLLKELFLVNHFIGTFFFSFGLKFFRDGIHSANLLSGDTNRGWMAYTSSRSFYDKPDFNIFSRPLDNMPGIADNGPLFGEFEPISGVISTSDAAAYSTSGEEVIDAKAPVIVHFSPTRS